MRELIFYKHDSGKCPVRDFLESLDTKQAQKVTWVLRLIEELEIVPKQYFKKLKGCKHLYEVRIQAGNDSFRILGFFDGGKLIVLNHAFTKKSQKTPRKEILIAEERMKDYFRRKTS